MKHTHTRSREWGSKSRKADERRLRGTDRTAALREGMAGLEADNRHIVLGAIFAPARVTRNRKRYTRKGQQVLR